MGYFSFHDNCLYGIWQFPKFYVPGNKLFAPFPIFTLSLYLNIYFRNHIRFKQSVSMFLYLLLINRFFDYNMSRIDNRKNLQNWPLSQLTPLDPNKWKTKLLCKSHIPYGHKSEIYSLRPFIRYAYWMVRIIHNITQPASHTKVKWS